MDLTRRTVLKGSAGLTSLAVPFVLRREVGRRDAGPSSAVISQAANQAVARLSGTGTGPDRSTGSGGSRGSPEGSSSSACGPAVERGSIGPAAVDEALQSAAEDRSFDWDRYRLDDTLRTTDRETVAALLRCDRTDWNDYTDDFYDCEEFAMDLRMSFVNEWDLNNVGLVYDESATPVPHVYNIVFYDDATFDLVEPQTDAVVSPGEDERYTFEDVTILL